MPPTPEWLELYAQKRAWTHCPNDLNTYFTAREICHQPVAQIPLGPISIPTGEMIARDPITYMTPGQIPYFQKVPTGEYQTEACVLMPFNDDPICFAAVRVRFSNRPAVYYEEALTGEEDLVHLKEGEYFGFNTETGLGCICDVKVRDAFCKFIEKWEAENPDDRLYEDYFSSLFVLNSRINPRYQSDDGDWISWKIPDTNYTLPIFRTGFGGGAYPTYYGYDENGKICQLVVQFVDIELAYRSPLEE